MHPWVDQGKAPKGSARREVRAGCRHPPRGGGPRKGKETVNKRKEEREEGSRRLPRYPSPA